MAQRSAVAEKELGYFILTLISVFYKTNLYNKLAKSLKIFVMFLAQNTQEEVGSALQTILKYLPYHFLPVIKTIHLKKNLTPCLRSEEIVCFN